MKMANVALRSAPKSDVQQAELGMAIQRKA
jgi:hypothetical protein